MSKLWTVERKRHDGAWVVVNRWGSEDEAQRHAATLGPEYRVHKPTARWRWTVRPGTDGHGADLFEVYAATMEEARASVERTAEESNDAGLSLMVNTLGFTVHALRNQDVAPVALARNLWVEFVPAPDFPRELAHA